MLSQRITSTLTVFLFLSITSAFGDENYKSSEMIKWSALIITQFDNVTLNGSSYCNGAYIGTRHVITAGMCVSGITKFRIKLGPNWAQYGVDIYKMEFIHDEIIISSVENRFDSTDKKLSLIRLKEDPRWPSGSYIQPLTHRGRRRRRVNCSFSSICKLFLYFHIYLGYECANRIELY